MLLPLVPNPTPIVWPGHSELLQLLLLSFLHSGATKLPLLGRGFGLVQAVHSCGMAATGLENSANTGHGCSKGIACHGFHPVPCNAGICTGTPMPAV